MNTELIELITKIILEKLSDKERIASVVQTAVAEPLSRLEEYETSGLVKMWDHLAASPQYTLTEKKQSKTTQTEHPTGMVKMWDHVGASTSTNTEGACKIKPTDEAPRSQHTCHLAIEDAILPEPQTRIGVTDPLNPEALQEWVTKTPARVGIGRAGLRPKTETLLRFRLDHGAAVDAVYGSVPTELLESLDLFSVRTMVDHKEEYIRRPDLGRRLSEEAKVKIRERCQFQPQVQIVASDGLSSQAIEKNLEDAYLSFLQSLNNLGIDYGTPFYIEKGRVASMDEVGEILQPEVVVLFIGERPGLISAESLSAYLCYKPRKGTIEADRMVISNIHSGGIPPVEAGAYLGSVVQKILKFQASGVSLIHKEG
jgi:ethanolamine ammonia-lyase small subunit